MSIDKLEPFSGHTYQSRPLFEIFKYLIKEKKPVYGWQDDYMWYPHMNRSWFESYVSNYYVHRQVRAVYRWRIPIQTRFEIFKYLI